MPTRLLSQDTSPWRSRGIAEFAGANIPFAGQGIVVARSYLMKQPAVIEHFLKGLLEGIDFGLAPGNKPAVLKTMTARLRLADEEIVDDRILRKIIESGFLDATRSPNSIR